MRRHFLILSLLIAGCMSAFAQEAQPKDTFDVSKHMANIGDFTFDDGKNSLDGFVNAELKAKTKCCGEDRIYLEVKIDPSGNVLYAKSLTGTNDCLRKAAEDIVKNIKWDAAELRGPKSVYPQVFPEIECTDERDNTFEKIEIYNNDLLDAEGNPVKDAANTPPVAKNDPPTPTVKKEKPEPKKEAPAVVKTEKEEVKEEPKEAVATNDKPTPKPQPEETQKEEKTEAVAMNRGSEEESASTDMAETESSDAVVEGETKDATRAAQEEEVIRLREQLAEMRKKEIEERRKKALSEEAMAAKEAKKNNDPFSQSSTDLYADDPYAVDNGGEGFGGVDGEAPEGERIEEELARLKQQIAELSAANEEREAQVKASMEEAQETNQEIIRIQEEIAAKEEEKERLREEEELAKIEEEKAQAEEARRADEEAYQRMMEEIKRLQEEADAKIAQLEKKKQEVEKMAQVKKMREQEIALERALREKEREAELAKVRMRLQTSGTPIAQIGDNSTEGENLMELLPDLITEVDSEKLARLIQTIQIMQTEITRLREQIALMEGNTSYQGSNPATRGNQNNKNSTQPNTNKNGLQNAAKNKDWRGIEYKQKDVDQSIYTSSVKNDPPQTNPNVNVPGSKDPAVVQQGQDRTTGNHENMPGPKFEPREYVGGKSAMKDMIKKRLKEGGVCGLGQALFSVTLNQSGEVIRSQILAANTDQVQTQLKLILPDLKFNESSTRIPQTVYLEFKAEILCENSDRVNLQKVEDIIKK